MDKITEKSCLEEISSLVLDASEKVTLKTISNNWDISNELAKDVLLKWLDHNEEKVKDIVKQFVVRGINTNGDHAISVVHEVKKDVLEAKWKNFSSWLYSVETKSNSRSLDLPDFDCIKVKNIRVKCAARELVSEVIKDEPSVSNATTNKKPVESMRQEVKPEEHKKDVKKSNGKLAGMFKQTKVNEEKTEEPEEHKKDVKKSNGKLAGMFKQTKADEEKAETTEEKTEEPISKSMEAAVALENSVELVQEKSSSKSSPEEGKSKDMKGKKSTLKNKKPVVKGSITSFFNSKPGTSKTVVPQTVKVKPPVKVEKDVEIVEEILDEPSKSNKRSLSPETSKSKKKASKKLKLKNPTNKRSRIKVIVDSSEDESDKDEHEDAPDSKYIKFDRELTPEPEIAPSPVKESPEKKGLTEKNKHKAKRWVTKRYQTEDGFMRTERVQEEYSGSENDENEKKNQPSSKKKSAVKSVEKSSPVKVSANNKIKQGSIMNFFNKK